MNKDCDTFCWQDFHLNHIIGSLLIIFFLNLSTILYKFIISFNITNKNLLILPFYSYIKVLLQIFLSLISITIKERFSLIFNLVFSLFMIGNLIISLKIIVFNYRRIQLM